MTFDILRTDSFVEENTVYEYLRELKGYSIAVEANWYLQRLMDTSPAKEPLVSALGGLPFALKSHFEVDLDNWNKAGIRPIFVFEGVSLLGQDEMSLKKAKEASAGSQNGWDLYTAGSPNEAVAAFGSSGAIQAKDFYRFFQEILNDRKLPYEIAAYSAAAHIYQMDKSERPDGTNACELVMGSLELLLYPMPDAIITKLDFEDGWFHGVVRSQVISKLAVSEDVFIDALLMTGNSFLPTFPALKDPAVVSSQPYTVKDAVNMYRTAGKSTIKLCQQWSDTIQKQEPNWLDRYRKAKLAVHHNIHLSTQPDSWNAAVAVNEQNKVTGDQHEYVGLQLPQELFHYLVHGAIGPRIMNWLAYLKRLIPPPLDGGDSEEYRQLVTSQLVPIRAQALALYTSRMHRAFQHKVYSIFFWFDSNATVEINVLSVQPSPESLAATWRVTRQEYSSLLSSTQSKPGSITFALAALQDKEFAVSTVSKATQKNRIKSHTEVLANTIWRFLHLRGYINDKHELTIWGKALLTTLQNLNAKHTQEEAAFLAFELLRLDQLNARNPHSELIGAPQRGSEQDKKHCLLISRCASLLKIHHKAVGYTGPLSKNLLAYHSVVSAVRETDRDLVEAVVASMFMFSDGDRIMTIEEGATTERKRNNSDWRNIGFSLPFGTDTDVALGIAVKTWLDDHVKPGMSSEDKEALKKSYVLYLPHGEDFSGDLEIAFGFFNALFDGIKVLRGEMPDEDFEIWAGARKYLAERC